MYNFVDFVDSSRKDLSFISLPSNVEEGLRANYMTREKKILAAAGETALISGIKHDFGLP